MEYMAELLERLCADEAVCFIADRHNVEPQQLLQNFFAGGEEYIHLEPNEVEILKGLSNAAEDDAVTNDINNIYL